MTTCSRCTTTWTGMKVEHCVVCCHSFTGTTAGDMHRVGDHAITVGPDRRRCLTVEEMEARGMARNSKGHWMSGTGRPIPGLPVEARNASRARLGDWSNPILLGPLIAIWFGGRIAI